ncbi:MAG: TolC family protein [Treponema sp.]|jgi:outer membrane protein|nr:TolC family protein [Treponema sp.]
MSRNAAASVFLFLVSAAAFSAELSLEEIRRAAVISSPTLKKMELSRQNLALAKMADYFKYLPSPSASASASYPLLDDSPLPEPRERLSAGVSLSIRESITVYDGGKSRIDRSNRALEDSSLDAETAAALFAVIEEADNRYFNYQEAAAALETAGLQMEMSSLTLEIAEIRRAGGLLSPGDYYLALSDKAAAEGALAAAQTGFSLAKTRLEQFSGIDSIEGLLPVNFDDYEGLFTGISRWAMEEIEDRYQKLRAGLSSRSPALKSASISLKQAENNYALSKSAFLPSMDLSLSFNLGYNFTARSPAKPLSYGASVTLGGTIPLDYWVLSNNERRQKNILESSRIVYGDALAAFDIELRSQLFTLAGSARALISSRRQAEYSALLLEQQQELFRLSSAPMTTLLDASSRSLSSETQKTKAEFSFLRSLSALKSLGAFDEEELFGLLGNPDNQ